MGTGNVGNVGGGENKEQTVGVDHACLSLMCFWINPVHLSSDVSLSIIYVTGCKEYITDNDYGFCVCYIPRLMRGVTV